MILTRLHGPFVHVVHAGPIQKFTLAQVKKYSQEGWFRLEPGRVVIETDQGPMTYTIVASPGMGYRGKRMMKYVCQRELTLTEKGKSLWQMFRSTLR